MCKTAQGVGRNDCRTRLCDHAALNKCGKLSIGGGLGEDEPLPHELGNRPGVRRRNAGQEHERVEHNAEAAGDRPGRVKIKPRTELLADDTDETVEQGDETDDGSWVMCLSHSWRYAATTPARDRR